MLFLLSFLKSIFLISFNPKQINRINYMYIDLRKTCLDCNLFNEIKHFLKVAVEILEIWLPDNFNKSERENFVTNTTYELENDLNSVSLINTRSLYKKSIKKNY